MGSFSIHVAGQMLTIDVAPDGTKTLVFGQMEDGKISVRVHQILIFFSLLFFRTTLPSEAKVKYSELYFSKFLT